MTMMMAMTMMMIAEYNLPEITCEFFMFQYLDAVVQYYLPTDQNAVREFGIEFC